MDRNTIVVAFITLVVGFSGGYFVATSSAGPDSNVSTGESAMQESDMGHSMDTVSADLSTKSGDVFDQAFISGMITHHEGAVRMAQEALLNAKHSEIKDMAKNIISAQNMEIQQMKQWRAQWYGSTSTH